MGQKLRDDKIALLTQVSTTQVSLPASYITIGGQQYRTSALNMNAATTGAGGLDTGSLIANRHYYVFAVSVSGVVSLVASLNSAPTGFTQYKVVGYFYTNGSAVISFIGYKGSPVIFTVTTVGTSNFIVPPDVYTLDVEIVGGGGGGGYHAGTIVGQGGSAGGYARKVIRNLTPGGSISVTIGAGGTGATGLNTGGGIGGTSSFGSFISATGGNSTGTVTSPEYQARDPGIGTGGDINVPGAFGGNAQNNSSQAGGVFGAPGYMGGGGSSLKWTGQTNGGPTAQFGYGAGGTGSVNGTAQSGSPGICVVRWTYGV